MFKKVFLCFFMILSVSLLGVACSPKLVKGKSKLFNANFYYEIGASCDESQITLSISDKDKSNNGDILDVVMLKPFEYFNGETEIGINYKSEVRQEGQKIGEYKVGEISTLKIDRFENDGYDKLYNKFLLAKDGKMVAGPFLVSDIKSERDYQSEQATTKKGVLLEEMGENFLSLGCGWAEYNVVLNEFIFPNERVDEKGNIVQIDNSHLVSNPGAIPFVSNGKTYFFKSSNVEKYDQIARFCAENNTKLLFICYMLRFQDQNHFPYFMTYPAVRDYTKGHNWAADTSTELGMGYNIAAWEFLADRYSREDEKFGHVDRYVVGNEIDISWDWNPVVNYDTTEPLPLEQYVEEYTRLLRIADQATKKYYSNSMVLVSTCHYWAGARNRNGAYGSKQIYDYLNAKISYQGNFDWGMAAHPYAVDLSDSSFLTTEAKLSSVNADINDSIYITWTNFEILDLYLAQEDLLFNGHVRRVYLTEGGVSSGYTDAINAETQLLNQAAGVAYAYYKSMSMDCVDAFIYYRLVDNPGDGGGMNFGIYGANWKEKPALEVFKYLDTQYSFVVADKYLGNLRFKIGDVNYGLKYGNVKSYYDLMDVVRSDFDWKTKWDESKIITRQIEPVEELEQLLNSKKGENE